MTTTRRRHRGGFMQNVGLEGDVLDKYDDLDAKIIKAIEDGHNKFFRLVARNLTTNWRLLERRLQALRKAGAVEYVDRRWAVKKP